MQYIYINRLNMKFHRLYINLIIYNNLKKFQIWKLIRCLAFNTNFLYEKLCRGTQDINSCTVSLNPMFYCSNFQLFNYAIFLIFVVACTVFAGVILILILFVFFFFWYTLFSWYPKTWKKNDVVVTTGHL